MREPLDPKKPQIGATSSSHWIARNERSMQSLQPMPTVSERVGKPETIVNLNFKVRKSFFRSYAIIARELDTKNNAFLEELLNFYVRANVDRLGNRSREIQRRFAELQAESEI